MATPLANCAQSNKALTAAPISIAALPPLAAEDQQAIPDPAVPEGPISVRTLGNHRLALKECRASRARLIKNYNQLRSGLLKLPEDEE